MLARPFVAVYGDELPTGNPSDDCSAQPEDAVPLPGVNEALRHAGDGAFEAVADVVRLMTALDEQQRAVALGNLLQLALVIGDAVSSRTGIADDPTS